MNTIWPSWLLLILTGFLCHGTWGRDGNTPVVEMPNVELVELLSRIITIPSVNGENPEEAVVTVVETFAKAHGLHTERLSRVPGRPILMVSVGPTDKPGLLLIAHTDTVSVGDPTRWKHGPFSGEKDGTRIYGRGAVDNKGGLVAAVSALLEARSLGLKRPLTLVCVPDEEAGATGELGINYLHERGKLQGLGAIYTYPGTSSLNLGHRGVWRFKVVISGEQAHTGGQDWQTKQSQSNALLGAAQVALEIEKLSLSLANRRGKGLFAPYATVLTPAVLHGGKSYGVGPDLAELKVDVRLIPSISLDEIKREVTHILRTVGKERKSLKLELVEEYRIPAVEISPSSPIVEALRTAATSELGKTPDLKVSGPANESYLLDQIGIPTVTFGPEGNGFHAAEEYVELGSIATVSRIYVGTLKVMVKYPGFAD